MSTNLPVAHLFSETASVSPQPTSATPAGTHLRSYCHTKNRYPMLDVDFMAQLASLNLVCEEVSPIFVAQLARTPPIDSPGPRSWFLPHPPLLVKNPTPAFVLPLNLDSHSLSLALTSAKVREKGVATPPASPPFFETMFPDQRVQARRTVMLQLQIETSVFGVFKARSSVLFSACLSVCCAHSAQVYALLLVLYCHSSPFSPRPPFR